MSPHLHRESTTSPYQVPGRHTPIPPSLRPGHNTGRRVSFASPPVQAMHSGPVYPPSEHDVPHRHRLRSASVSNTELHFNQPGSSYVPTSQYPTHSLADAHRPASSPQQDAPPRPPKRPDFLIVGLFALRLAKKLIHSLDKYPERDGDIGWINKFLAPYTRRDTLAQITGDRMDDYVTMYPAIVARFIKQPRYPFAFTELNPDRRIMGRRLTDQECIDMMDFADAASEWGSTVKLPGLEAERIERLSERRRMAHY